MIKKIYKLILLFILSFSLTLSKTDSELKLPERKTPATLKIGVTKLKTTPISVIFDGINKVIFGEIKEIKEFENSYVYLTDNLEIIPSLYRTNGRVVVNKLKKVSSKFKYSILKKDEKYYIKIDSENQPQNLFIYVVGKDNYKIKKVYRAEFPEAFALIDPSAIGTFKVLQDKLTYFVKGTYLVRKDGIYIYETKQKALFAKIEGNYPQKYIDSDKFDDIGNYVYIIPNKDDSAKNWFSYDEEDGSFDTTAEYAFSVPTIKNGQTNSTGAKIRIFCNNDVDYVSWQLLEWDGGAIDSEFKLEYYSDEAFNDILVKTDSFKISVPDAKLQEIPITISNPIVMFDEDGYNLGRVVINSNGSRTLDSTGTGTFTKNGDWIKCKGVDYLWDILKSHKVVMKSDTDSGSTQYSMANGGTYETYIGLGDNEVLTTYEGGSVDYSFGVLKYDFKSSSHIMEISHSAPTSADFVVNKYIYRINLPQFDPLVYYDDTKDIKISSEYIKKISNLNLNSIEIGTIGLKDLDIRITKQSGGTGIKIRGGGTVYLKSVDYPQYPIIKTELKIKNSENLETKELIGENEKAKEASVSIVLNDELKKKLVVGGRFKIVKSSSDNSSPLEIGVEVNGDQTTHFKPITNIYIDVDRKYLETAVILNNDQIPLDISQNKGWIKFNKTNYSKGELVGYPGQSFGEILGDAIDIPADCTLEILDESQKNIRTLTSGQETDINIGNGKLTFSFENNYVKFGVKSGQYHDGDKGNFYIMCKSKDGSYKFIQKYIVSFNKVKFTNSFMFELLNPLVIANKDLKNKKGMVSFSSDSDSNCSEKIENNFYTAKDSKKWWKVLGFKSKYPDFDPNSPNTYIFLDSNRKILGEITQQNFSNPQMKIIILKNNVQFKVGISSTTLGKTKLEIGLVEGYDGKAFKDQIYICLKNSKGIFRTDKMIIDIAEFDPREYAGIYPAANYDIPTYLNKVGSGVEKFKTDVSANTLIDLNTNLRTFMRYFEPVVKMMTKNHSSELLIRSTNYVQLRKVGTTKSNIKGKIKFVQENNGSPLDEIKITENKIDKYIIKVELTPEEYKKLELGEKYEIYYNNDFKVLEIGLINETTLEPWTRKIELIEALNFKVSPPDFEITAGDLDFGYINKNSGKKEVTKETTVTVKCNKGTNFKLEITDPTVTTNTSGTEKSIKIYKLNTSDFIDTSNSLDINNLTLIEGTTQTVGSSTIKTYKMQGNLQINPNVENGKYINTIEVTATLEGI